MRSASSGWWRILEAKAALKSALQTVTRHYIVASHPAGIPVTFRNPACYLDGRRLDWPVLLLQLIELSALLSFSHQHPLSITKVTQEMEYPKGVTDSKAR